MVKAVTAAYCAREDGSYKGGGIPHCGRARFQRRSRDRETEAALRPGGEGF